MGGMNRPQNSDRMSLDSCLAVMARVGVAPGDYILGYGEGFRNDPYRPGGGPVYDRGRRAGRDAYWRGAHGSEPGRAS